MLRPSAMEVGWTSDPGCCPSETTAMFGAEAVRPQGKPSPCDVGPSQAVLAQEPSPMIPLPRSPSCLPPCHRCHLLTAEAPPHLCSFSLDPSKSINLKLADCFSANPN